VKTALRPHLRLLDGGKPSGRPHFGAIAAAQVWHPSRRGGRPVLLYISGEADHRLLFTRWARQATAVTLVVTAGGVAAAQMAMDPRPRIVVVDACVADVHAETLVAGLRRASIARDVPIVVLGRHGTPRERAGFLGAGATAYVADRSDGAAIDRTVGMLLDVMAWR